MAPSGDGMSASSRSSRCRALTSTSATRSPRRASSSGLRASRGGTATCSWSTSPRTSCGAPGTSSPSSCRSSRARRCRKRTIRSREASACSWTSAASSRIPPSTRGAILRSSTSGPIASTTFTTATRQTAATGSSTSMATTMCSLTGSSTTTIAIHTTPTSARRSSPSLTTATSSGRTPPASWSTSSGFRSCSLSSASSLCTTGTTSAILGRSWGGPA
mmetsp:Transcript_55337/g.171436  ORF Transcript_55337/g.171436 Transcript_55337/m.171436 type:complete len:218 (+) Transcript_55337:43-696(+)